MSEPTARPGGAAPAVPPGPGLPAALQTVLWHRRPEPWMARLRERYGDLVTVRTAVAGTAVAVLDPGEARRLAESDPEHAHTGEGRRTVLGMVSPRSVLGGDGAVHRDARAAVASAFSAERLDRLGPEVARITAAHVRTWPRGRPVRLLPRLRAVTDHVFVRCVLGVDDVRRGRALALAVQDMLGLPGNPPLPPPVHQAEGVLGALGSAEWRRRSARVRRLLAEEVAVRRAAGDAERRDGEPRDGEDDDVLACLLRSAPGIDDERLLDAVLALLLAGQEPPAAALTWSVLLLARHPEHAAAVRAGVAPGEPGHDVVREVLRYAAPVHSLLRTLTTDLVVAGRTLPAGTTVQVPTLALQRDGRVYPDPHAFRPARWAALRQDPPGFLPFGGGIRRCLGHALAWLELRTALPVVLRTVDVRPAWPREERQVLRATVTVPHRSALVVLGDR